MFNVLNTDFQLYIDKNELSTTVGNQNTRFNIKSKYIDKNKFLYTNFWENMILNENIIV